MRALALDVGLKRIGVALCIDKIAIPLEGLKCNILSVLAR